MTQNVGMGAPAPVGKQGSWVPKVLIGCGVALLVFILACAVSMWFMYRKGKAVVAEADQAAAEFVDQGFVSVEEVPDEAIAEKTVIRGGAIELDQDSTADVAIVAAGATVRSHIGGNLYFRGVALEIAPGAVIDGDVDMAGIAFDKVKLQLDGTVKGKLKGSYELRSGQPPAATDEPAMPEATPATPAAEPVPADTAEETTPTAPTEPEPEAIPAGQSEPVAPEPAAAPAEGEPAPAATAPEGATGA